MMRKSKHYIDHKISKIKGNVDVVKDIYEDFEKSALDQLNKSENKALQNLVRFESESTNL